MTIYLIRMINPQPSATYIPQGHEIRVRVQPPARVHVLPDTPFGDLLRFLFERRDVILGVAPFVLLEKAGLETQARRESCAYRSEARNAHSRAQTDRMSV